MSRIDVKSWSFRKNLLKSITYFLMIILAFYFLFPTVFMVVSSLKTDELQLLSDMSGLKGFIPAGEVGLRNFRFVFQEMPFARYFFNSVFILAMTVGIGLFINSMFAFSLARLRFRGRAVLVSVVIALIIVPTESVVIPMLLMVNKLGWIDSYHVQIIPFIADAFSVFLFYQFFIQVPKDFDEAAIIDGTGYFSVYTRIIAPLSRPVFASVAILQGIQHWGRFLWPLMVTRQETFRPLPVAIQQFFSQDPKAWGAIFAFASMTTIPLLIIFLVFQKWFVQSVASSGVKG
ncbi:carbohydrate ABC transporter permease [Marispirochaeta aestuarii]|uniref:carbohydrate ABC transporter permease n=1 Tax=Marispirochaeta aestuarii TaxID=1963862 RepID=UPI0029C8B617|nr:carbohydrate ABC transporter permease [Marispirochaeta aestuarii]